VVHTSPFNISLSSTGRAEFLPRPVSVKPPSLCTAKCEEEVKMLYQRESKKQKLRTESHRGYFNRRMPYMK